MKKIIYTIGLVVVGNIVSAQGILGRIKNKVSSVVDKTTNSQAAASGTTASGDRKYTDPSQFGKVIFTFSKQRMAASPEGYDLWFPSVKVVNNQLELKIAEYSTDTYVYSGGQITKINEIPDVSIRNKILTGCEKDSMSVDFTEVDYGHTILKDGPHLAGGPQRGKLTQVYTFNGKVFADFSVYGIVHNPDSTVVAGFGTEFGNGTLNNCLLTSSGQRLDFQKKNGGMALVSPDGKISAALFQGGGMGGTVSLTNGTTYTINGVNNNLIWLRNNGNIFYFASIDNKLTLEKNGKLYHKFDRETTPSMIFISSDDKSMCWFGSYGLYFSDGTAFENGASPHRVRINNKDVIIFLDVNLQTGNVYLCQHDL